MAYSKTIEIPLFFRSRATMGVTFVPWVWGAVNSYAGGNDFREKGSEAHVKALFAFRGASILDESATQSYLPMTG